MAGKRKLPANYLDSIPVRDGKHPWRMTADGTAEVDMEHTGFYDRIAQKIWKKPRVSHIALDKYGTVVWKNMNGENTVADIVRIMEASFPDETDRMLDRVVTFTATLQRSGFITMSAPSQT